MAKKFQLVLKRDVYFDFFSSKNIKVKGDFLLYGMDLQKAKRDGPLLEGLCPGMVQRLIPMAKTEDCIILEITAHTAEWLDPEDD